VERACHARPPKWQYGPTLPSRRRSARPRPTTLTSTNMPVLHGVTGALPLPNLSRSPSRPGPTTHRPELGLRPSRSPATRVPLAGCLAPARHPDRAPTAFNLGLPEERWGERGRQPLPTDGRPTPATPTRRQRQPSTLACWKQERGELGAEYGLRLTVRRLRHPGKASFGSTLPVSIASRKQILLPSMSQVTVTFDDLVDGLASPAVTLRHGARLQVPSEPKPFVPPVLHSSADPFSATVLLVEASAAVGKTTFANALAARLGAPLLDLGTTAVSTESLRGLLGGDLIHPVDADEQFTSGRLPIIVDALDEGRLLSNENAFEEFLDTTWRMLDLAQTRATRPCIVLVGRHETWEMVAASLLDYPTVASQTLSIAYFDREPARQLVQARADAVASPGSAYWNYRNAAMAVIDTYFESVAGALDMNTDEVWRSEVGRAFAGYAPVLVALGDVLARTDNLAGLQASLKQGTSRDAWGSIEQVAEWVLGREGNQLRRLLADQSRHPSPEEAYDRSEQYRLLADYVQRGAAHVGSAVPLCGDDFARYKDLVQQKLPEHPFLRAGEFVNPVLGSLVLAEAANAGQLVDHDSRAMLEAAARQPFLWRSVRHRLAGGGFGLCEGFLVGYVLNSRASDATEPRADVVVRPSEDSSLKIHLSPQGADVVEFSCLAPVRLYARVGDTDLSIEAPLQLHGVRQGSGRSTLTIDGCTLVASRIEVDAERVDVRGKVWLEAPTVSSPPRLDVVAVGECLLGWSGQFDTTYPWNRQVRSLYSRPGVRVVKTPLEGLLDLCAQRLSQTGHVVLNDDLTLTTDARMNWARRDYAAVFPQLAKTLLDCGLASQETFSAAEGRKLRVRLNVDWDELFEAVRAPTEATTYRDAAVALLGLGI
jgi:hypothetical protein